MTVKELFDNIYIVPWTHIIICDSKDKSFVVGGIDRDYLLRYSADDEIKGIYVVNDKLHIAVLHNK